MIMFERNRELIFVVIGALLPRRVLSRPRTHTTDYNLTTTQI